MKKSDRSDMPQVEQLIRCSKISVFFIDDKQNVRSQEIGSSELIIEAAKKLNKTVSIVNLHSQFRCMGSNDYLLWLESALGYTDDKRILNRGDLFDFRIIDSPKKLYKLLSEEENKKENSARLIAGFCWPWSKNLNQNGELIRDVQIGNFSMPWETHMNISSPPKGYVRWYEWAYKPDGFKQVGCIYTAQGFEFDYIGVIIGDDLKYSKTKNRLVGNINATKDPRLKMDKDNFEIYIKNIYRTLLSRGMKGCYVHFVNKETEKYFKDRME